MKKQICYLSIILSLFITPEVRAGSPWVIWIETVMISKEESAEDSWTKTKSFKDLESCKHGLLELVKEKMAKLKELKELDITKYEKRLNEIQSGIENDKAWHSMSYIKPGLFKARKYVCLPDTVDPRSK